MKMLQSLLNRLWFRLTLAFAVVLIIGVTANAATGLYLAIQEINAVRGEDYWELEATFQFTQPGGVLEALATYYKERGSWDGIEQTMQVIQSFNVPSPMMQIGYLFQDEKDTLLFDSSPQNRDEWINVDTDRAFPIEVKGKQVGTLTVVSVNNIQDFVRTNSLNQFVNAWLREWMNDQLGGMALTGILVGMLFGFIISRSLSAPLKRLSDAAQAIGTHNLDQRVEVAGSTEVKNLAQSFNSMLQRLEREEQLRKNLVADVAHELRTPLTVLQGNLRAILDDVYPLSKAEVAGSYDQTRMLSRLVNDLHEIAQAEANKLPLSKEVLDVSNLLHSIGTTFGMLAEAEGVSLTVRTQMKLLVIGDYTRLSQVIHNLLTNALHHTPEGGSIHLQAERDQDFVVISVTDTGVGINADHLPHVFERFYRADRARSRNRGGTGLGLAITKAIVTAHGGRISVESEGVGHGTKFTVHLPDREQPLIIDAKLPEMVAE